MKKKKKKENKRVNTLLKGIQRKLAMEQGYYDGRFATKKVKDKKKEADKKWARKKGPKEE